MTAEERERAELARRSVHGYRTYGAYATAVLEAVTMIRETPVGDKTALARREKFVSTNCLASALDDCGQRGQVLRLALCGSSESWRGGGVAKRDARS